MRIGLVAVAFFAIGMLGWSGVVDAKSVGANSKEATAALGKCSQGGGLNFTQGQTSQTWGCLAADGHGVVCGGETAEQKKTCDIFRTTPPRLPTRDEVRARDGLTAERQPKAVSGTP